MPKILPGRRAFGGILTFGQVLSIVRELKVDDVRQEADLRPHLLIVAPDQARAAELGQRLAGWTEDRAVVAKSFEEALGDLNRFDVVVAFDPDGAGRVGMFRDQAERQGTLTPIVRYEGVNADDERSLELTRRQIVDLLPERAVAFGRAFPPFRPAAAASVTQTTSRANAQFAFVSNLPAAIPLVGSLIAAGADLLVLTKNQLLLLFKIAAIHGRDLRDTKGILAEMVPVVGAGFAWRTAAREAASFLPLAAGTLPKMAIAFVGTMVIGRAADYYYRFGYAPTRRQRKEFYKQATLDLEQQQIAAEVAASSAKNVESNGAGSLTEPNSSSTDSQESVQPTTDPAARS